MGETSLHESIKRWYSQPGDLLEEWVDGYLIDIVRNDILIEIQTSNFSSIKEKLGDLVIRHPIRLVHPIAQTKWIVRLDERGKRTSRRRSPRTGRVEDLFLELVYIPYLMKNRNFSLDVLLVHCEEEIINDGRGSWRRGRWSIHDRRLLSVVSQETFSTPASFLELFPLTISETFTTQDLAEAFQLRANIAQKITYTLRHMGVIETIGKRRRATLYSIKN